MDLAFLFVPLFGLCVGSFLNVLITRLPDPERSLFRPLFSACPHCDERVRARDNIPLLGFILLRGKCRDCATPIGWTYPVVELVTALLLTVSYVLHGPTLAALSLAVFLVLLLVIAVTDLRTYLIPDLYTLGGAVLGLVFTTALAGMAAALRHGVDALVVSTALWALGAVVGRAAGREALGFGDVLLVGMMATFIGLGSTVIAIYVAAVSGLVFYVLHHRHNPESLIPFGLHLAIGGALVTLLNLTTYANLLQQALPWY